MTDPRVADKVEEALDFDRTAEEVCAGCPELIEEVRQRMKDYRALEAELDVLFPRAQWSEGRPRQQAAASERLPELPGYEFVSVLGRGGMGVVYLARHLALKRLVAVKMLLAGAYAAPSERARFLREAQALALLRHPHIVSVFDVGEVSGRSYFTMEHLSGGTLATRLGGEPKPVDEASGIALALADAVAHAHQSGIVHRDLKPSNVLLAHDGALKVGDFGLARSASEPRDVTLSGARLGTPSYMSPEQALGRTSEIGPATDVYGLGAILYEALTGRPPFRGDSAAETERQLLRDEPAPPRLLNTAVPADLETICLNCLQKLPARRYPSATALASDLRRFRAGEPISARPVGWFERGVKWVRRSPTRAALIAVCALSVSAGCGAAFWTLAARASRIADVEAALAEGLRHEHASAWKEAGSALDRASARLGGAGPAALRARLDLARDDLKLVDRLEAIRFLHAGTTAGTLNDAAAAREYAATFRSAGLGSPEDPPSDVAERIRRRAIATVLIGALDDWLLSRPSPAEGDWIEQVSTLSDDADDPREWRRRARDPSNWSTREKIAGLADEAPVEGQPVTYLYAFARLMEGAGVSNLSFLSRAQLAHPGDFWLTTGLANALRRHGRSAEAVGYYRAAVALRPDAMAANYNLGLALGATSRPVEAQSWFRVALRCDPDALEPLKALGLALADSGQHAEAIETYGAAALRDPEDSPLQLELSWSYANTGRYQEAVDSFARSVALGRQRWNDPRGVHGLLVARGRHGDALNVWREHLKVKAAELSDWDGFAELCLFVGDTGEYRLARGELLRRFAALPDPNSCERIARACLLSPTVTPEELGAARTLIDRALAAENLKRTWAYPYFRLANALADFRAGDAGAAARAAEGECAGVLGPFPLLLASLSRAKLGDETVARRQLADASLGFDWTPARADNREAWMYHVLRREAQRSVFPDLELATERGPIPDEECERCVLLGACQAAARFGRCAELWTHVISDRAPTASLAEAAARALLVAASGAGVDAQHYSTDTRGEWRALGLRLLSARLAELERSARESPGGQDSARKTVAAWEAGVEFAHVRDARMRESLTEAERSQWTALWSRAHVLAAPATGERR